MHVVGIKQEIVERHPWVATNLYKAFEQSKAVAMERMENPRIVPLAWYREGWEEQERILGKDPWEYGLAERNAKNFERLVTYSHEQGLIKRPLPLDRAVPQCLRGPQTRRIQDLALGRPLFRWPRNIEENP